MKIKSHIVPIFLLILISILVHHVWFFNLLPITQGDWMFNYSEKVREFFDFPRVWLSDSGFGGLNFGISFWPYLFVSGIIARLNINVLLLDRLLFLWPIALLIPISMYFFSYYIFHSKIAAFISALIFEFNTYIIILKTGHLTLLMANTLVPFLFLCYMKILAEKKLLYVVTGSILAFIISFYEFRIFYLVCWLMFFYTLYYLIIIKQPNSFYQLIKLVFFSAIPILITLLLNIYFLLGTYGAKSLTGNAFFNRSLVGASYIKLTKILTLFHFGWTGGKMIPFMSAPLQWQFLMVPLLTLLGFLVNKNNKVIPFFAFLGVLGIFLNKTNTVPFPAVYQWLYEHLPGFNAFRESGKFMLYVTISYSILIGSFIDWLWQKTKDKKPMVVIASLITILAAMLFLWNAKPMITGELGTLFVSRQVPKDYLIVKDFILGQPEYFRTLSIPTATRWTPYNNNHPLLSSDGHTVNNLKLTNELLDISSVKYVFIPLEDKINDDNFFEYMGKRQNFINQLNKLNYLKKINIGTKEIVVYENNDYRPHIYITDKKETIYKNVSYEKIDFSFVSPTEYKVNLKTVSEPIYLNFSESFHPDWKIRVGELNWLKVIIDKNYFLPDKIHFQNDAELNSFYLDPRDLCNKKTCSNVNLTLYFQPQSYVYFGGIISLLTFISCLMFFILEFVKLKRVK